MSAWEAMVFFHESKVRVVVSPAKLRHTAFAIFLLSLLQYFAWFEFYFIDCRQIKLNYFYHAFNAAKLNLKKNFKSVQDELIAMFNCRWLLCSTKWTKEKCYHLRFFFEWCQKVNQTNIFFWFFSSFSPNTISSNKAFTTGLSCYWKFTMKSSPRSSLNRL